MWHPSNLRRAGMNLGVNRSSVLERMGHPPKTRHCFEWAVFQSVVVRRDAISRRTTANYLGVPPL